MIIEDDRRESFQEASINRFLKNYGNTTLDPKKPLFRLVWSEDLFEKRLGEWDVWSGPLFIRTETGVREVPKYNYIDKRYILEQWFPPEIAFCREVSDSVNGDYYAIYVFETKAGKRLSLNQRVVELIMYSKFHNEQSPDDSMRRIQAEQELKDEKYRQYIMDSVETTDISSNLHFGEAIIVPPQYDVSPPNLRGNYEPTSPKQSDSI